MSKHTPGPWRSEWANDVGPDDDYYVEFFEILDSEHKRIGTAEEKADGRLMAAAPDLLEAIKRLADWAEQTRASGDAGSWDWSEGDEYTQARAAIAKAEAA